MNLPDLSKVEIPKRISASIVGALVVAQMPIVNEDLKAILVTVIIVSGIISQTITDKWGKKPA